MLKPTPLIVVIFALIWSPYTTYAAIHAGKIMISATNPDITLIDLDALTDQDKRRLDFYAGKIIESITDLSMTELTGDRATIDRKISAARDLAARFTVSSEKLGLTVNEARQYFLSHFVSAYAGRLPDAMLSDAGNFDLDALFAGRAQTTVTEPEATGGYIDLLRDEGIGGLAVPD